MNDKQVYKFSEKWVKPVSETINLKDYIGQEVRFNEVWIAEINGKRVAECHTDKGTVKIKSVNVVEKLDYMHSHSYIPFTATIIPYRRGIDLT